MSDYALPFVALGVLILFCVWRAHASDNRRDARLMSACGAGSVLAGAAVWLVCAACPSGVHDVQF